MSEQSQRPFHPRDLPDFPPTDESGEVDLTQVQYNLSLTPTQRLEQNDRFAEFIAVVREGGRRFYGRNA
jgi:hypothetical protein